MSLSLILKTASEPPTTPNESASPLRSAESADAVNEVVGNTLDRFSDVNWWVDAFAPVAIRVTIVIFAAIIFRYLLVRGIDRLVDRRVAKQLMEAEATSSSDAHVVIKAERSAQRATTLGSLFRSIITVVVYTFATLVVMAELGFNLGPLIAGAGIVGLAVGFGAQSLVADFLSGIFILMEDQYGVGDVVDVGDATGTVEEVQLRVTKIRGVDGVLWFVRNGEIMRVGNKSQDWSRTVLDIGIAYGADIRKAKEIMMAVGKVMDTDPEYGDMVLETPEVWGVEDLGADSVVIRMVVKTKPGEQWTASRVLRERIKSAFDDAGIEIPFAQRTVWIRNGDEPREEKVKVGPGGGEIDGPDDHDPKPFNDDPAGFGDGDGGDGDFGDGR